MDRAGTLAKIVAMNDVYQKVAGGYFAGGDMYTQASSLGSHVTIRGKGIQVRSDGVTTSVSLRSKNEVLLVGAGPWDDTVDALISGAELSMAEALSEVTNRKVFNKMRLLEAKREEAGRDAERALALWEEING